ncbi:unnamed protein product [Caretta caretta]
MEQGMWTVNSFGHRGNQREEHATLYALAKVNEPQAYILPERHQELVSLFRIILAVLSGDVVQRVPGEDNRLHNWMSEKDRCLHKQICLAHGLPLVLDLLPLSPIGDPPGILLPQPHQGGGQPVPGWVVSRIHPL